MALALEYNVRASPLLLLKKLGDNPLMGRMTSLNVPSAFIRTLADYNNSKLLAPNELRRYWRKRIVDYFFCVERECTFPKTTVF